MCVCVCVTFTNEQKFLIGVWRDRLWPDGWTAVTADGKRSAQFEHTLLVRTFLFSPSFYQILKHNLVILCIRSPEK